MSNPSDFSPSALLRQIRERLAVPPSEAEPPAATIDPPPLPLPELERLLERLDQLATRLTEQDGTYAPLIERLAALEKQITRAGREQFKATTLAEAQHEQTRAALEMLQAADAQHTREVERLTQQLRHTREQVQLEYALAVLPLADSLDQAMRSGQQVLDQLDTPLDVSWLARTLGVVAAAHSRTREQHAALQQWLHGLTFVQQRVFDLLNEAGITPIVSIGQPFDPHMHVAIGIEPASPTHPDGIIVAELRRGYQTSQRVVRHADVVVARTVPPTPPPASPTDPEEAARSSM